MLSLAKDATNRGTFLCRPAAYRGVGRGCPARSLLLHILRDLFSSGGRRISGGTIKWDGRQFLIIRASYCRLDAVLSKVNREQRSASLNSHLKLVPHLDKGLTLVGSEASVSKCVHASLHCMPTFFYRYLLYNKLLKSSSVACVQCVMHASIIPRTGP